MSSAARRDDSRLRFLDLLRAFAAQLIVWHHLAFYGPLADGAHPLAPYLLDALHEYGRMAVQIFLVVGGFVTARHLDSLRSFALHDFGQQVLRRYWRTGGPYLVTLALAVVANAVADSWMDHRSISAPPTVAQLLAHVFYAQDVLGYPALSAGIWYLAIDFQLFVLVLAIALLAHRMTPPWSRDAGATSRLAKMVFAALALASLFYFNRKPYFDCWAVYFFGSYFLGMLLRWVLSGALVGASLWVYLGLMLTAVAIDWRPRLLVAAVTALAILLAAHRQLLQDWPKSASMAYLGRISFSLFLVHFPICLVVNAWFSRLALSPLQSWLAMFAAYAASLLAAMVFHHLVELPIQRAGRASTR